MFEEPSNCVGCVMVNVLASSTLDHVQLSYKKNKPKTMILILAASPLSIKREEQILVGSESGKCQVFPCTVVSAL
jgi:hypothetical protein